MALTSCHDQYRYKSSDCARVIQNGTSNEELKSGLDYHSLTFLVLPVEI